MKFSVDQFSKETEDQSEWLLSGWAFLPGRHLTHGHVALRGEAIARVFCGWPRVDVCAAFPAQCPSEKVGFRSHVILPAGLGAGGHALDVILYDESGQEGGRFTVPFSIEGETRCGLRRGDEPQIRADHPQHAYLDLLEKTLLGLTYANKAEAVLRQDGRDWPQFAHTMIGQTRLRHLRACAETVLRENIPGDFMETGVWRGGACILLRGVLKAYGDTGRTVWLADSFQGLPAPNPEVYLADVNENFHTFPELAVSLNQVKDNFESYGLLDGQVRFVEGFFSKSLPQAPVQQLALLRLDGDLYESTMDALKALYPKLSPGGICIIDDYGVISACRQAVRDYRAAHGITDSLGMIDWTAAWWKKSGPADPTVDGAESSHVLLAQPVKETTAELDPLAGHHADIMISAGIPLGRLAAAPQVRRHCESSWAEHVPFAFWMVEHLQPALIVELGVHHGLSYCAFCQAVTALRLETKCRGIDTFKGDAHAGFYGEEILANLRAHHDPLYSSFSELCEIGFDEALVNFADGSIDLLHIDGLHTYGQVRHDFETWLPKLSSRAVVLFHDSREFGRDFGVWRFLSELARTYPSFEFYHGHGLGVVAVGNEIPPPVASLFSAGSESQDNVRQLFSILGNRLTLQARTREDASLPRYSDGLAEELSSARQKLDAVARQQVSLQQSFMQAVHAFDDSLRTRLVLEGAPPETLDGLIVAQQKQMSGLKGALTDLKEIWLAKSFVSRWVAAFPWINRWRLRRQRRLMAHLELFDASFYFSQLPAGLRVADPLTHYLRVGWRCGLSPHRLFDTAWYVRTYRDLLGGREPLADFLENGWLQNRCPHPLFDVAWYLQTYPEVASKKRNPLRDYLKNSIKKARRPNPHFDTEAYLATFGCLMAPGQTPLEHYLASEEASQAGVDP